MRLRIRFTKLGKVRFTGHRDVARIWERSLRKAQVPIALTEGFSPRPRLSFGLALPTGAESLAEYLDVEVAKSFEIDLDGLDERLTSALPPGFSVAKVEECLPGTSSLQESVVATGWDITIASGAVDIDVLRAQVEAVMTAERVMLTRERKGERTEDDVRPVIESLEVVDESDRIDRIEHPRPVLRAVLVSRGRGIRPHEVVAVTLPGSDPLDAVAGVLRTHQWTETNGARQELLPAAEAPVGA